MLIGKVSSNMEFIGILKTKKTGASGAFKIPSFPLCLGSSGSQSAFLKLPVE